MANYRRDTQNRLYATLPNNRRVYIYKQGTIDQLSVNFRKQFREGNVRNLPANFPYAYNKFTKRFVDADKLVRKDGRYRKFYQDQLIEESRQTISRFLQRRRERTAIPINQWIDYVRGRVADNTPFLIRLVSGLVAGVSRDFNFTDYHHFRQFVENIMNADYQGGSGSTQQVRGMRDVFANAVIQILPIEGGCNHKCGGRDAKLEKVIDNTKWKFHVYNPVSQRNDCAFKCLEHIFERKLNIHELRKTHNLKAGEKVPIDTLWKIYESEKEDKKLLTIIDPQHEGYVDTDESYYIVVNKDHYYVLQHAEKKKVKNVKCKRGDLSFDFETRPDYTQYVMVGNTKSYLLHDTICAIHYRYNRSDEYHSKIFTTNRTKSSARQFLDWLQEQHYDNKHFNIVAHNGANFDNYFLVANFTQNEQQTVDMQLRGTSIIGMQYYSHLFKDSCCFLTNSLNNLCKQYKIETKKLTDFDYKGTKLTNANLCFFKPELGFWEFMELESTDPEYWGLYTEYCLYDCYSLTELWKRFNTETNGLIEKMNPALLAKCSVMSCNTIGSLAKKLVDNLQMKSFTYTAEMSNGYRKQMTKRCKSFDFAKYCEFIDEDIEKYRYICQFKRGGISHCNQAGKHTHEVCSYDITSQYPTALINMIIPAGKSEWTTEYKAGKYGYYTIKNLKFDDNRKFKPIAYSPIDKSSLDWVHDWKPHEELKIGSELLKYMIHSQGLISFEVVDGLVSNCYLKGYQLFGSYVNVLFQEKANQDELKSAKDPAYNPAFREVIKLFLNSITGKLVEDPSRYFSLKYTGEQTDTALNGVGIVKEKKDEDNMNIWVNAGCCVYDYSKMLLFKYVECLPNGSDDVIHIETDSIYFNKKDEQHFIENVAKKTCERKDYPIEIGSSLGNVKNEHTTGSNVSYFLGKKFYYLECVKECQEVMRIKGIPLSTIDEAGNRIGLVNKSFYERIYGGEEIKSEFATLQKKLFGNTRITSHRMTRITRPNMKYHVWK